jgi:hypothetical protein
MIEGRFQEREKFAFHSPDMQPSKDFPKEALQFSEDKVMDDIHMWWGLCNG